MPSERDRTRLIAELASLLHDAHLPEDARCASLTLIGWLARRMPGEAACTDGVEHARKQLELCGGLLSQREDASHGSSSRAIVAARASTKRGSTTVAVRVESRAMLVRSRRGRPSGPGDEGHSPRAHVSAESRASEAKTFGPDTDASSLGHLEAGVPRPHGRKPPAA